MAAEDIFDTYHSELRTRLIAIHPELSAAASSNSSGGAIGIHIAEEIAGLPLATLKTPFAVIHSPSFKRADFGHNMQEMEVDTEIYYVGSPSERSLIRKKAAEIANYFDDEANDLTDDIGQIVEVSEVSSNRYLPLNREFIEKQMPLLGAAVVIKCWLHRNQEA